jgi:hypothetical protein
MAEPLADPAVKGRETVVALVTVAVPRVGALGAVADDSNWAVTVTANAGIVKVYGPDPDRGAVLLTLKVATSVPAFSCIPDFGKAVKVTVVPDAEGEVAISIVDVVSPETRVIVPKVIA